jgi:hypothetical protein
VILCVDGKWFLSNVVVENNHYLSPRKKIFFFFFFRCYKNIDVAVKRRIGLNDRDGICTNKNFNSLVVEKRGMSILLLKRNIVGIILKRQESFDLANEVLKHFMIILVECKSRIIGSIM